MSAKNSESAPENIQRSSGGDSLINDFTGNVNSIKSQIPDENEKVTIIKPDGSFEIVEVECSFTNPRTSKSPVSEEGIENLFRRISLNDDDEINDTDIERFLLELNRRYGRNYGKEDALIFFNELISCSSGGILNLNKFKQSFLKLVMNFN